MGLGRIELGPQVWEKRGKSFNYITGRRGNKTHNLQAASKIREKERKEKVRHGNQTHDLKVGEENGKIK